MPQCDATRCYTFATICDILVPQLYNIVVQSIVEMNPDIFATIERWCITLCDIMWISRLQCGEHCMPGKWIHKLQKYANASYSNTISQWPQHEYNVTPGFPHKLAPISTHVCYDTKMCIIESSPKSSTQTRKPLNLDITTHGYTFSVSILLTFQSILLAFQSFLHQRC